MAADWQKTAALAPIKTIVLFLPRLHCSIRDDADYPAAACLPLRCCFPVSPAPPSGPHFARRIASLSSLLLCFSLRLRLCCCSLVVANMYTTKRINPKTPGPNEGFLTVNDAYDKVHSSSSSSRQAQPAVLLETDSLASASAWRWHTGVHRRTLLGEQPVSVEVGSCRCWTRSHAPC